MAKDVDPVSSRDLVAGPLRPTQTIFLKVPSVSKWQWHPVTVASVHLHPEAYPDAPYRMATIEVHLRRQGWWTSKLSDMALKLTGSEGLPVKVQGPFGGGDETRCGDSRLRVSGNLFVHSATPNNVRPPPCEALMATPTRWQSPLTLNT